MDDYQATVAWWRKLAIRSEAELDAALQGLRVAFAYHSGKIENERITYNDTRDIFERGALSAYTGELRTLFEISNAKEAHELLLAAFGENRPLDAALIKDFQRCLTQKTYDGRRWELGERPGEYKKHDYVTGREEVGALPEDVEEEMEELIAELDGVTDEKALIAAAYFHAKLENIHPFADGNGRTGRLAMNYFLLRHRHPPLVIHEEDRHAYYAALEAWDTRQDLTPLVDFLQQQTVKTWRKRRERTR